MWHRNVAIWITVWFKSFEQFYLAGLHDKNGNNPEKQEIEIAKVFNHPLYEKKTKHHDVSVLKLKNRIRYGEHIQPACMAHVGWRIPEGKLVFSLLLSWISGIL